MTGVCGGVGEHSVPQASLVIIRHAPRIVQPASQAMMTQTAWVADSGSSDCAAPGRADASGYPRQPECHRQPGRLQVRHGQPDE